MARHLFLSLLFAVLLIFTQQAAMLHPYVHVADLQHKSTEDKQAPKHLEVCGKCVALADIENTVSSQSYNLNITFESFKQSTTAHVSIASEHFFSYHSRAPPSLA